MRIITGKARGLKLKTPKGFTTRPTSDRIKESIFNILNGLIDFEDKIILDLFAGTGALGLEALSRGAAHATFVDIETIQIINDNIIHARFNKISEVIRGDVIKVLNKFSVNSRQFDIIFCDPPYNKGLWQRALNEVDNLNLLKNNGLIIIEHGLNETIDQPLKLALIKQKKYGHTTSVDFFQKVD